MNGIRQQVVEIHKIEREDGVRIIRTTTDFKLSNVYVCTLNILPSRTSFAEISSFFLGMVVSGRLRGKCSVGNELNVLDLLPGSVFIIPPHTAFDVQVETRAEIVSVYISDRIFKIIENEFLIASESPASLSYNFAISDSFLSQTILSMKEITERGGTFAKIEIEYFARVLAARLIAEYSSRRPAEHAGEVGLSPNVLDRIVAYIDENINDRLTAERLSAMAGLGSAHFARLFKRSTNVTLHQYIILRRIERARVLLEETDLPVVEIAQECGFADQVHLTRFFSRIVGASPASFRRKTRDQARKAKF